MFLRLNSILCHVLFTHSSIDGQSSCFLAIMNDAVMNMGVQIPHGVAAFNSLGYVPRRGNCWIIWQFYIVDLLGGTAEQFLYF